jgi:hypothetical protein
MDRGNNEPEFGPVRNKALPSRGGERVEARTPVVFRRTPLGGHQSVQKKALESRVQRAFADVKNFIGQRAEVLGDPVTVSRSAAERLQDQHVESAGQQFVFSHRLSMGRIPWPCPDCQEFT